MICIYSYFKIIGDFFMFFDDILNLNLETEYYFLDNENFSFHFGADILNLLFLNDLFTHFSI